MNDGTEFYITTLFTFNWNSIVETINFYKEVVGGTTGKIFVGGIMASLMADELFEETGIYPVIGILNSPSQINLPGTENIDLLPPDYGIIDQSLYAINDTYYGYTSRGCVNRCSWCGVPSIEPEYIPYIDIKPMIRRLREEFGDKPNLKLMDNNVLASPDLKRIVADLEELGYGRDCYTDTQPKRLRVIDFNQGVDATFIDQKRMKLFSRLNINPMRVAFDRTTEKNQYIKALKVAHMYGIHEFSNYMLYNWRDSPRDLYDRLVVNIKMNEEWKKNDISDQKTAIYSYPMRFAPIKTDFKKHANRYRDLFTDNTRVDRNWLKDAVWTRRFVRNIEIMRGATHGAISPTPSLAWRTIGESYEDFLANLYMPEELLRNRNKHERYVSKNEPKRPPGTGEIEDFRYFVLRLLKKNDSRFHEFHSAVEGNSVEHVRNAIKRSKDEEIVRWLQLYLKK